MLDFHSTTTDIQNLDKKNISFAKKYLKILAPIAFKTTILPSPKIIFIHTPKTGGTTLDFIAQALSKSNVDFFNVRFAVPRIPNRSPGLITKDWISGIKSAENALETSPNYCEKMNFISGHFPYGLHKSIQQPAKYITLIRNPIDRTISSTNFDFQRGYINGESATDYLLNADIDNPQTRMLAGQEFRTGECNRDVLDQAKKNIKEHFLLTGVTEDTDSFIQILASIQNWGTIAISTAQVTGEKIFTNISEDLVDKLSEKHSFDIQLYEWAKAEWLDWKEKFTEPSKQDIIESDKKILCIPYDFANTRTPLFLNEDEINHYNKDVSKDTLVQINQNHTKPIEPTIKPQNEIKADLNKHSSTSKTPITPLLNKIKKNRKRETTSTMIQNQSVQQELYGSFVTEVEGRNIRKSRRLSLKFH